MPADTITRVARFAETSRRCSPGRRSPAPRRGARRLPRSPVCPRWSAPGVTRAAAAPTSPRPRRQPQARAARARRPQARAHARRSTCPSSATRSQTRPWTRRVGRSWCGTQPRLDRSRPDACARGPAPRRPLHGGARAVHDRYRGPRRRGAAGYDAARAPPTCSSPGVTTVTWNEPAIEPRGEAKQHRDLPAAGEASRARRPLLQGFRRSSSASCSRTSRRTACASAAG